MSQLVLQDSTAEENNVVERFIQQSRDLAPTVQISLAKRIIHPGSNRVVCLAAHTSVPLNPDELASVSDLALRLSDGTNVRLSVSFFDDAAADDVIPLTRSIYDPQRYTVKNESKLPLVLTCMLAFMGSATYCYFKSDLFAQKPLKQPAITASAPHKHAVPAAFEPASVPATTASTIARAETRSTSETRTKAATGRKRSWAPRAPKNHSIFAPAQAPVTATSRPSNMFVPPPPPMALPLGNMGSVNMMDLSALGFGPQPKAVPPKSTVKAALPPAPALVPMAANPTIEKTYAPAAYSTSQSAPKPVASQSAPSQSAPSKTAAVEFAQQAIKMLEPVSAPTAKYSALRPSTPRVETASAPTIVKPSNAAVSTIHEYPASPVTEIAPSPGANDESPALERISAP